MAGLDTSRLGGERLTKAITLVKKMRETVNELEQRVVVLEEALAASSAPKKTSKKESKVEEVELTEEGDTDG